MKIDFNSLLHPDWRYVLLLIELLIVLVLDSFLIGFSLIDEFLIVNFMILLPLLIGYPVVMLLKKRGSDKVGSVFGIFVMIELVVVMYFLSIFGLFLI